MLDESHFVEVKDLGHGAFGRAGIFRHLRSQKQVAVKTITFKNDSELETAKNEIKIMKSLKSEFVVRCYGYFIKENTINIVMEYCEKGDLQQFIDNLQKEHKVVTDEIFFEFAAQLASGISFIHSKQILHRDLKPANIFLSNNSRLKIGDFGISKILDEQNYAHTVAGTRSFLSPEMLQNWTYTEKVDLWSIGILLYILVEQRHPFDTKSEINLVQSITNQDPAPFVNLKNESAKNLILSLLNKDAAQRPNADDILNIPEIAACVEQQKQKYATLSQSLSRVDVLKMEISDNIYDPSTIPKLKGILEELTQILKWTRNQPIIYTVILSLDICDVINSILSDYAIPDDAWNIEIIRELQFLIGKTLPIESVQPVHMKSLNLFSMLCPDSLIKQIIAIHVPQLIIRNLKSRSQEVAEITSQILKNIAFKESNFYQQINLIPMKSALYEAGFIKQLFEDGFVKGITQQVKTYAALTIGWVHNGVVLPEFMNIVVTHLKDIVKQLIGNEEQLQQDSLSALSTVARCKQNHSLILQNEFLQQIPQFLRNVSRPGYPISCLKQFKEDGTINRLTRILKNNSYKDKNINKQAILNLGFIFRAAPLPLDIRSDVINGLKEMLSNSEYQSNGSLLFSIGGLVQCKENHPMLLSSNIISDILSLINQNKGNKIRCTQILKQLFIFGTQETRNAVKQLIPMNIIIQLAKHTDYQVRMNSNEIISWIMHQGVMNYIATLIQQLTDKSSEERGFIAEQGCLQEICQILIRINKHEDGMAAVSDPICQVISLLIEGNPQLVPQYMNKGGVIDQLIIIIEQSQTNEAFFNQIESMRVIANECLDDQLQELFRRGVVKIVIKHLNSQDQKVIVSVSEIIERLIQSGTANLKVGQINIFRNEIEKAGIIQQLVEFYRKEGISSNAKDNIALATAFHFKAYPMPQEYSVSIIDRLKILQQSIDEKISCRSLLAISGLAKFEYNHRFILSNDFAKEIVQHMRNKSQEKACIQALHLVLILVKRGSKETKAQIEQNISSILLKQLSCNRNSEIAIAAKVLYGLQQK
ncbi:MAG: putative protein kinase domain protein [Streblomastix strix]|uniref:non-specific serine/threonine protein kinase n=1 Tax=Streblomastix strix TaxID=222440 RepID=A0A5J4X6Y1_9EUKA|nr:MAG: putative protein kinase domain protein [Streblomastix strix]